MYSLLARVRESPLLLLLVWAGKEKYKLYAAVICGLCSGIMVIIPYMAVYQIMEMVYYKTFDYDRMVTYSLMIAAAAVIRNLFMAAGIVFSHKGAYNALYRVRARIINHLARVSLGCVSQRQTGEIKKVISEDIEKLELFLAHHLLEIVMYAAGPLGIFLYLYSVDQMLALITLVPVPIAMWLQGRMFAGYEKLAQKMHRVLAVLNSSMIEYINGMKLIKAYNLGGASYQKYAGAIEERHALWTRVAHKMGPLFAAFIIVLQCAVAAIVPAGGFLFMHGNMEAGVFILFTVVGSLYLLELRPLLELGSNLSLVLNGIKNAKNILAIPPLQLGGEPFPNKQDIAFGNVSFSYTEKDRVLKNVNLAIRHGEKIALVGKSGAGKSTILQLLARFYDVSSGQILIGGQDVKTIGYRELLDNIAVVFQNTFLTRHSVLENIRMGTKATLEEVEEAAKKAQIHDFIAGLPEGYHTKVGNYGSRFSGGEKQRIAIARAILKKAPLLLLDEAASGVDPENQREIDKAIANLCKDKTTVIVAHRLDIVRTCDRIAVVENNTVVAIGTHEELMQSNSYYRQITEAYEASRNISYHL